MSSKRYRLKLEHPYAKAGTIVTEEFRSDTRDGYINVLYSRGHGFCVPLAVMDTWLEELKEEVTFTKEQVEALEAQADHTDRYVMDGDCFLVSRKWLTQHTAKEE